MEKDIQIFQGACGVCFIWFRSVLCSNWEGAWFVPELHTQTSPHHSPWGVWHARKCWHPEEPTGDWAAVEHCAVDTGIFQGDQSIVFRVTS